MRPNRPFITTVGAANDQLGSQMNSFAMLYVIAKLTGHVVGILPSQLTQGSGQQLFARAFDSTVVLLPENCNTNFTRVRLIHLKSIENELPINEILHQMNRQNNFAFVGLFHFTFLYFLHFLEDMRDNLFRFKLSHVQQAEEWLLTHKSPDKKHAAIHFRRTDYLTCAASNCSLDYYKKSLSHLDPAKYKLFVFSDDINYCKENKNLFRKYEVSFSENNTQFVDMYLMTQCDANIIANSTFSTWGALLNRRDNLIICPENMVPSYIDFARLLKPYKSHIFIKNPYI